ncbi:uncharacterized protein LOC121233630 [Aquila chrysaetos chrysaetos]|uniref:uncharacterized protein LOC121233630 n=1 Tax=Aquila chrysaetos chrysaetos TaxID=223781 RepID=UPI001B7D39C4|nr:uncharacterized protein LOC121233630 [Aquila chrysaetos chrysaetos]
MTMPRCFTPCRGWAVLVGSAVGSGTVPGTFPLPKQLDGRERGRSPAGTAGTAAVRHEGESSATVARSSFRLILAWFSAAWSSFWLIPAWLDAGFPSLAHRLEELAHGSSLLNATKSPSDSTDNPAAEFPEDPSASKALHPNESPRHGICQLVATTIRAETEELPGGCVLCLFRLRDGGKKATFLLNELVNTGEECHQSLEISRVEGNYPGSQLEPWELPGSSPNSSRIEIRSACSPSEFFFMAAMCFARKRRWREYAGRCALRCGLGQRGKDQRRPPALQLHSATRGRRNHTGKKHAAGVCPVQARWECAGPCDVGRDLARRGKNWRCPPTSRLCSASKEKNKKKKHVGGKKNPPLWLESARLERAGPCELGRDLARWGKIGAVLLHRDSVLPCEE